MKFKFYYVTNCLNIEHNKIFHRTVYIIDFITKDETEKSANV